MTALSTLHGSSPDCTCSPPFLLRAPSCPFTPSFTPSASQHAQLMGTAVRGFGLGWPLGHGERVPPIEQPFSYLLRDMTSVPAFKKSRGRKGQWWKRDRAEPMPYPPSHGLCLMPMPGPASTILHGVDPHEPTRVATDPKRLRKASHGPGRRRCRAVARRGARSVPVRGAAAAAARGSLAVPVPGALVSAGTVREVRRPAALRLGLVAVRVVTLALCKEVLLAVVPRLAPGPMPMRVLMAPMVAAVQLRLVRRRRLTCARRAGRRRRELASAAAGHGPCARGKARASQPTQTGISHSVARHSPSASTRQPLRRHATHPCCPPPESRACTGTGRRTCSGPGGTGCRRGRPRGRRCRRLRRQKRSGVVERRQQAARLGAPDAALIAPTLAKHGPHPPAHPRACTCTALRTCSCPGGTGCRWASHRPRRHPWAACPCRLGRPRAGTCTYRRKCNDRGGIACRRGSRRLGSDPPPRPPTCAPRPASTAWGECVISPASLVPRDPGCPTKLAKHGVDMSYAGADRPNAAGGGRAGPWPVPAAQAVPASARRRSGGPRRRVGSPRHEKGY